MRGLIFSTIGLLLSGTRAILAPIEDPCGSTKYSMNYLPFERWEQLVLQNTTALATGTIVNLGDSVSCYVPNVRSDLDGTVEQYNETELNDMLNDGVNIITNSFKGCLPYLGGFWNYELCSNSGLSQFDGDPQTSTSRYQLGRIKQSVKDRDFQLLYDDFGYYISELVGSGDICDLTGHPRVVEIQYVCRPAAGSASIQWVREIKTCHYEIQVAIPGLCNLEILSKSEDQKISNSIVCVNADTESSGSVDLISYYKPTFIGNEIYLLEPYDSASAHNRTTLLYSGNVSPSKNSLEGLDVKLGNAISRMVFQHQILLPDGLPYSTEDRFSWVSEVLDSKGNFLTTVQFNLSSTIAEINLDDSLTFKGEGNFHSFERNAIKKALRSNLRPEVSDDRDMEGDSREITKKLLAALSPEELLEAFADINLIEGEQSNTDREHPL